jgi:hypothetical protein
LTAEGAIYGSSSDDGSDLAVISLPSPQLGFLPSKVDGVFISDFAQSQDDIYQGAKVLVLGYPQFLRKPDDTNPYSTTPVARNGIIAWVDPSDPLSKPFLVDANLYGGNSGGPVFAVKNGFDKYGTFSIGGWTVQVDWNCLSWAIYGSTSSSWR